MPVLTNLQPLNDQPSVFNTEDSSIILHAYRQNPNTLVFGFSEIHDALPVLVFPYPF